MRIPFVTNKRNSPPTATLGETSTSKNIASPSDRMGIEVIRMDECSAIAGGPQISNRPDIANSYLLAPAT